MTAKVGDKIPSVELYENTPENKVNISQLCSGKKVIIFAVPGAYTPGCSNTHLPGYLKDFDKFKAKGVAEVICVAVNDAFVMSAWGKEHGVQGKVRMLADTNAVLTKALGLDVDLPPLGGTRSKRYSMVVENGVIVKLNVEPENTGLTCSLSNNLEL